MLKIQNVDDESIGSLIGLQRDDEVVAFNSTAVIDVLDYAYYDSQEKFTMSVKRNGNVRDYNIIKTCYDSLGLDFYDDCYLEPSQCANNCIFCFVNQLPNGLRESLYVKDDDWRLSFVSGNYITLSHINDKEVDRIIDKQFSPLYISVHTTNDELRCKMLGRYNCMPIIPLLKKLAKNNIIMHAQIVLCPDVNDGEQLSETLNDLYALYPKIASVAVVPVGLTKYRDNLPNIKVVDKEYANKTINLVEEFAEKCFEANLNYFAYCSDEMYQVAERELPSYDYYGDFEQYENGVGIIARFNYDWNQASQDSELCDADNSFTIICGQSAYANLSFLVEQFNNIYETKNNVIAITNEFFGDTVTVSGLVVGKDIISQCNGMTELNKTVLVPSVMMRETENIFLDGTTLEQLQKALKRNIEVIIPDGYVLFNRLCGISE